MKIDNQIVKSAAEHFFIEILPSGLEVMKDQQSGACGCFPHGQACKSWSKLWFSWGLSVSVSFLFLQPNRARWCEPSARHAQGGTRHACDLGTRAEDIRFTMQLAIWESSMIENLTTRVGSASDWGNLAEEHYQTIVSGNEISNAFHVWTGCMLWSPCKKYFPKFLGVHGEQMLTAKSNTRSQNCRTDSGSNNRCKINMTRAFFKMTR